MAKKTKTPRHDAATVWLKTCRKGESHVFWVGEFARALRTPEQNMSNEERRLHSQACKSAKKSGTPKPKIKDPYKAIRADAKAVEELVDHWTLRGLIETKITLEAEERIYEMVCVVQRNGLRAVRERRET